MSINDFIDYVTRFDRDFPSRIRGGSPQEVQQFADLALELTGKQIPESVRDYMLSMGLDDGGLRPRTDYPEMNVQLLVELYQDIKKDDAADDSFAENCLIIGYEGVTLPDMSVEVIEGSDAPPRVVATSGAELKHEVAESLENHLYQRAFSRYRVEPLPAFFGFYPRDRSVRLDAFARAAAAVGIRAEPFSDRDVFCGTNGPVFAAFYQAYRAYPYAVFASEDAQELDRVTFAFQGEIPMERIAPKP